MKLDLRAIQGSDTFCISDFDIPDEENTLYRCVDIPFPCIEKYKILRRTPKGVWILAPTQKGYRDKFVLLSGKKRFAYPTKKEALFNFIKRKEKHLEYLINRKIYVEHILENAKNIHISMLMDMVDEIRL